MAIDPSASLHPTAIIAEGAVIGAGCTIGPYAVIGAEVTLGPECEIKAHVCIDGVTSIGKGTSIYPFASLGQRPQDLKFKGERTVLEIGEGNTIREYVTMNPGTEGGGGVTRVGDGGLFMNHVHVGHDCIVGNGVICANAATLGGHVSVGDGAVLGGLCAIHQHCRIGAGAMVGGMAGVVADVIPYGVVMGPRADLEGLNLVGLRRRGVDKGDMAGLRAAFAALFEGEGTLAERAARVAETHGGNPLVDDVIAFIRDGGSRHFSVPA